MMSLKSAGQHTEISRVSAHGPYYWGMCKSQGWAVVRSVERWKKLTILGDILLCIIIIFERLAANHKPRNFVGRVFSRSFHPFMTGIFVGYVTSQNKYVAIYALRNVKNLPILLTIAQNEVAQTFTIRIKLSFITKASLIFYEFVSFNSQ